MVCIRHDQNTKNGGFQVYFLLICIRITKKKKKDGKERTIYFCISGFDFLDYSPNLPARAAMINHSGEGWSLPELSGLAEEI